MMFVGKEAEKIERLIDILEPYVRFNGTTYIYELDNANETYTEYRVKQKFRKE